MAISSSLYSSISGLNTLGNSMSVLGDNVANVNTIAFKSSRATFQDVLSQSVSTAAGTAQVGRGVTLSTVDGIFAQGSFESTSTATDLAIGGQGFFMLRAPENAESDMYSRAGEFRFDQEGFLVNPVGNYVQGWTLETATGERAGTIGDINLGKSTPPVETQNIEVIANLDSREINEASEVRLYDAWNGTNASAINPSAPIDSANYEYTSSIKVYDSKGASHDIAVYFDRTTTDNEWEFLVSCEPSEDLRALDTKEKVAYAPDATYNYDTHKGAGALMYGVINFNTSGDITKIASWDVPPDGNVDHNLNTNRLVLNTADKYYSFEANFTGATSNQRIELNLGARYKGIPTPAPQTLVSDIGAFSDQQNTTYITEETTWDSVFNSNGTTFADGDTFTFDGYNSDGTALAAPVTYTITTAATDKVSGLLTAIEGAFSGVSASIDAMGRLKLTDSAGGDSAFHITSITNSVGEDFFGPQINISSAKTRVVSPGRAFTTNSGTVPVATETSLMTSLWDITGADQVIATDQFSITGKKGDGTNVTAEVFTVTAQHTVQDFLDFIEDKFDADAWVDNAGRLVVSDRNAESSGYTSLLEFQIDTNATTPDIFGAENTLYETIVGSVEDGSLEGDSVSIDFETEALASTQYANSSTTIFQDQNGYAAGFLQSVSVDTDGVITGHYSNGQVLERAQVALASFNNLAGLSKEGGNIFRETTESGAPVTGAPGANGLGSIAPNSLEQSNVDLGNEFVKLITTQRGFQANSKIITTTDEMLADLINIKR
ncbi:flagellar hook-basal body complex protein [Thermodesulfobacteriota bacterium]